MKRILLFMAIILGMYAAQAQNCNAVFFNQEGSKFQVVLDGVLQNMNFETNVKVADLKYEGNYKVTIIFENKQLASITKSIYMLDNNTEYSYEIKKNKKGEHVMRPNGMVAITQAPTTPQQAVVSYSTTPPVAQPQATTDVVVTETITTTTTVDPANQENVSVGMNVGGVGMNVNVSVNDGGTNTGTNVQTTSSQTVTTTTVTSSSTSTSNYNDGMTTNPVHEPIPVGCHQAIPSSDFNAGKASVEKQSFADTKLKVAKTFTKNNCLSVSQIKEIMSLFSFEETKIDYAKYAYESCADKKNYYQLSDGFTFSTTVDEFNEFLETK